MFTQPLENFENIRSGKSGKPQPANPNPSISEPGLNLGLITPVASPIIQPNNFQYYNCHLNKCQFNNMLVICVTNLLKILYGKNFDYTKLKNFVIELLKRSKTSIQILQLTSWYLMKLINSDVISQIKDPRKLFLGLIIIASKFNQDFNYSFKTWLKIVGFSKSNTTAFNINDLKLLEINCLKLLDYKIYLNNLNYENWCNILIIFGYDFLKTHLILNNQSHLIWEDDLRIELKLLKWKKFFLTNMNIVNLHKIKINFDNYYSNQLGKKIIIKNEVESLFNKRCHDDDTFVNKRQKTSVL